MSVKKFLAGLALGASVLLSAGPAAAGPTEISALIERYYFNIQNGHRADSYIVDWGSLWAIDAVMEDPADTAFGYMTGRTTIENRLRFGFQTMFERIDMKPKQVVIQWTEHRASVLWELNAKFLNAPTVPADKRGKTVQFYGITNFVLDATDTQIKKQQAIWDYTQVF